MCAEPPLIFSNPATPAQRGAHLTCSVHSNIANDIVVTWVMNAPMASPTVSYNRARGAGNVRKLAHSRRRAVAKNRPRSVRCQGYRDHSLLRDIRKQSR
jgi:hypothetical protein